jgi:hypothetical protein
MQGDRGWLIKHRVAAGLKTGLSTHLSTHLTTHMITTLPWVSPPSPPYPHGPHSCPPSVPLQNLISCSLPVYQSSLLVPPLPPALLPASPQLPTQRSTGEPPVRDVRELLGSNATRLQVGPGSWFISQHAQSIPGARFNLIWLQMLGCKSYLALGYVCTKACMTQLPRCC